MAFVNGENGTSSMMPKYEQSPRVSTVPNVTDTGQVLEEYEVDHLASLTVSSLVQRLPDAEAGMLQLKQLEENGELRTIRCSLRLEQLASGKELVVLHKSTSNTLERFPLSSIISPMHRISHDTNESYNNVVLFTVAGDGLDNEVHIFQSVVTPADKIVEQIMQHTLMEPSSAMKMTVPRIRVHHTAEGSSEGSPQLSDRSNGSTFVGGWDKQIADMTTVQRPADWATQTTNAHLSNGGGYSVRQSDPRSVDKETFLLNLSFDDVERFVGRLQLAVVAFRELQEREKQEMDKQHHKKTKGKHNALHILPRLPPVSDFVDCLKKIKFAIILLARLNGYVADPNPPEMVRHLFKILRIVVDSSRNTQTQYPDVARRVVSPLLTHDAIRLLKGSLHSEEELLWIELGDAWMVSREDWGSFVPNYFPRFFDGYQPNVPEFDMDLFRGVGTDNGIYGDFRNGRSDDNGAEGNISSLPARTHSPAQSPWTARAQTISLQPYAPTQLPRNAGAFETNPWLGRQKEFLAKIEGRGERAFQVSEDRVAESHLELSVQKGEFVQLLDNSRPWWKVQNCLGGSGFCPPTILHIHEPSV